MPRSTSSRPRALFALAGACLLLPGTSTLAQTTGGVFGPVVNEGHRSMQYRIAHDVDSYTLAQRLHYQQSLDDDRMWRVIVQARKTADSNVDMDFVQGELFWQLDDISERWQHGFRFDVRVRTEGRPGQLGWNWTNEFLLENGWRSRLIVLMSTEVGEDANGDLLLGTRANLTRRVRERLNAGVEMFSGYGAIDDLNGFSSQLHQLGPHLTASFDGGWQLFGSALFGLTDATPDLQARLFFGRSF